MESVVARVLVVIIIGRYPPLNDVAFLWSCSDLERLRDKRAAALSRGVPFEYELRERVTDESWEQKL